MCLITEDRKKLAMFTPRSVAENIAIVHNERYEPPVLNLAAERGRVRDMVTRLSIAVTDQDEQTIAELSGGQPSRKRSSAARLLSDGLLFIFDEPTKGVDVGARAEIFRIMVELAKAGKSIIMVSSDMPELISMSWIGKAIAIALAGVGCDVAVNYIAQYESASEVCSVIKSLGRRAEPIKADVSRAEEVEDMVRAAAKKLGDISILVNNAGIAIPKSIDDMNEQTWDETIRVNLKSCFLVTQAVLPGMRARRWGRIINISSTAAQVGGIIGPHYAASKAGIQGLTHSYASRLTKEGVTCNSISPALIATEMLANNPNAQPDLIPMGRFGTVEEIAQTAVLLAGNGYITGQNIQVNGGFYFS